MSRLRVILLCVVFSLGLCPAGFTPNRHHRGGRLFWSGFHSRGSRRAGGPGGREAQRRTPRPRRARRPSRTSRSNRTIDAYPRLGPDRPRAGQSGTGRRFAIFVIRIQAEVVPEEGAIADRREKAAWIRPPPEREDLTDWKAYRQGERSRSTSRETSPSMIL